MSIDDHDENDYLDVQNFEQDSIYGSSHSSEDLAGLSIQGEYSLDDDNSIGDDWLALQDSPADPDDPKDSLIGGQLPATAKDRQLGRFSHMEEGVKQALSEVATGDSAHATRLETRVAQDLFEEATGVSAASFVKELDIQAAGPVRIIDPKTNKVTRTLKMKAGKAHTRTALSMMGTIEGYEQRGPGEAMEGNILANPEKEEKRNEDLQTALGYAKELADMYIPQATKDSDLYGARFKAVEASLIGRWQTKDYHDSKQVMPMPNETGVLGLLPTQGQTGGAMGTPFTRAEFGIEASNRGWDESDNRYWRYMPSLKKSLLPIVNNHPDYARAKKEQLVLEEDMLGKARFAAKVFRDQYSIDKIRHNEEQELRGELMSEASILDIDHHETASARHAADPTGRSAMELLRAVNMDEMGRVGKGTDKTNLYGEKPLTAQEAYVRQGMEGATKTYLNEDVDDPFAHDPESRPDAIEFEGIRQRTDEWYAARRATITASKLTNDGGRRLTPEEMAIQLAKERFGVEEDFLGNAHTKEGQIGEKKALNAFLSMMQAEGDALTHTEVGLIKKDNIPSLEGFGASPDGRLSDSEGKNRGLLELKFLSSGQMDKALKKYTPQMQLQMAVTGETETNFFALDKHTGKSIHEVVQADPKMIAEILSEGKQAHKIANSLLTPVEIQILEKRTARQRRAGKTGDVGQTTAFRKSEDIEEEIISFTEMQARTSQSTPQGVGPHISEELLSARRREESADSFEELNEAIAESAESSRDNADAKIAEAKASNEKKKSDADAARNIEKLGKAAGQAAKGLVALAMGAKDSAMKTLRVGAVAGMTGDETRGAEFAMRIQGGLSEEQTFSTIQSAGELQKTLGTGVGYAQMVPEMFARWGSGGLNEAAGALPSNPNMPTADWLAYAQGVSNRLDGQPKKQAIAMDILRTPWLAASKATEEEMATLRTIDEEEAYAVNKGYEKFARGTQEKAEAILQEGGEGGGKLLGASDLAAKNGGIFGALKKLALGSIAAFGLGPVVGTIAATTAVVGGSQLTDSMKRKGMEGNLPPEGERSVDEQFRAEAMLTRDQSGGFTADSLNRIMPDSSIQNQPSIHVAAPIVQNNTSVEVKMEKEGTVETKVITNGDEIVDRRVANGT